MRYAAVTCIAVMLGLSTRAFPALYPDFVTAHFGDALWACMVYFGFRMVFVERYKAYSLCLALLFSYGIEVSQLYQAEWIRMVRSTLLGGLILGKGFLPADLIRYAAGILVSYAADRFVTKR